LPKTPYKKASYIIANICKKNIGIYIKLILQINAEVVKLQVGTNISFNIVYLFKHKRKDKKDICINLSSYGTLRRLNLIL